MCRPNTALMSIVGDHGAVGIRELRLRDLRAALRIERQAFGTPWSGTDFALELCKPRSICLAAVDEAGLVGYIVCSPEDALWNLRNLAVHHDRQRQGVGSLLMSAALRPEFREGRCFLEVRSSDAGAIALYKRFDFRPAGVRPAFYRDDDEDAFVMWRSGPLD